MRTRGLRAPGIPSAAPTGRLPLTRLAACLALLLACAAPACADIVTYQFTGTRLGPTRDPVVGGFSYDTSSPDLLPPDPHHARYRETLDFRFTIEYRNPAAPPLTVFSRGYYYIDVYDDAPGDRFLITAPVAFPFHPFAFLGLGDSSGAAFSGVGLPASLDLAAFDSGGGGVVSDLLYDFTLTSLTATPEPSTLALLGLGGVALVARVLLRRRPAPAGQ